MTRRYSRQNPPVGWTTHVPPVPEDLPKSRTAAWDHYHRRQPKLPSLKKLPVPYISKFNPKSFNQLLKYLKERRIREIEEEFQTEMKEQRRWVCERFIRARLRKRRYFYRKMPDGSRKRVMRRLPSLETLMKRETKWAERSRTSALKRAESPRAFSGWRSTWVLNIWCMFGTDWPAWKSVIERAESLHDASYWLPDCTKQLAFSYDISDRLGRRRPPPRGARVATQGNAARWRPSSVGGELIYGGLREYLIKYRKTKIETLEGIVNRWTSIPPEDRGLSPKQLDKLLTERDWVRYQEEAEDEIIPGLFRQAIKAKYDVWGSDGDETYIEVQERWVECLARLNYISDNPDGYVPFYQAETDDGRYRMRRLSKDDPRGLWLGAITDCCQYPSGAGEDSAWDGHCDPYSAFFIVEDTRSNEIVAQSWVWMDSPEEHYVFDSIEVPRRYRSNKDLGWIITGLYEDVADQMRAPGEKDGGEICVNVGEYDNLPVKPHWPEAKEYDCYVPIPHRFEYSDADAQNVIVPTIAGEAGMAQISGREFEIRKIIASKEFQEFCGTDTDTDYYIEETL